MSDEGSKDSSAGGKWFENYMEALEKRSTVAGREGGPYRCPCCGFRTLAERGGFGRTED